MTSGVIFGPEGTLMISSCCCVRNFRLVPPISTPNMFMLPPELGRIARTPSSAPEAPSIYTRNGGDRASVFRGYGFADVAGEKGFGTSVDEWPPLSFVQIANCS